LLVCSDKNAKSTSDVIRIKSFGNLFSLPIAPTYPFALLKRVNTSDIAILHAPFPYGDLVFGTGFGAKCKFCVFWHSDIVKQKWLGLLIRPLIKRTLARADKIFVSHQSVITSSLMLASFAEKIVIVPFPVRTSDYDLTTEQSARVSRIKQRYSNRLVVACGRLVTYKGFDVLVDAAHQVNANFVIIGEGNERQKLQAKIDALGLSDRVNLVGSLSHEELVCHLHAADIFVLPSITSAETFGIVQLEAMACSCPIINTRLSTAVPDVARDGIEAITVAPGRADELVAAIKMLLEDRALAARLGRQGAERVKMDFTSTAFATKIKNILFAKAEAA